MFKEILIDFLTSKPLSQEKEEELIKNIKIIIYFALKSLPYKKLTEIYSKESLNDEILSEVFIKLLGKRDLILQRIDKIDSVKSYIKFLVINYLKDKLKKAIIETEEISNLPNSCNNELQSIIEIDAKEFMDILKGKLTLSEKESLCSNFLKIKHFNKSKFAMDKAKSRAKEKFKKIVYENNVPAGVVEFIIDNLFVSEICENIVNKIEVKK